MKPMRMNALVMLAVFIGALFAVATGLNFTNILRYPSFMTADGLLLAYSIQTRGGQAQAGRTPLAIPRAEGAEGSD